MKEYLVILLIVSAVFIPLHFSYADIRGLIQCKDFSKPCTLKDALDTAYQITKFLMKDLAIPLAALSFMAAGILMLTAGGNTARRDQAKAIFTNTAIGFAVILAAYLIVDTLLKFAVKI